MQILRNIIFIVLSTTQLVFANGFNSKKSGDETSYEKYSTENPPLENSHTVNEITQIRKKLENAKSLNNKAIICESLNRLGKIYLENKQYKEAHHNLKRSLSISINDDRLKFLHAESLLTLGSLGLATNRKELTISCTKRALQIAKDNFYSNLKLEAYKQLGSAYHCLGKYQESISNYEKCLPFLKSNSDLTELASIYHKLAIAHFDLQEYDKALSNFTNALSQLKPPHDMIIENRIGIGKSLYYLEEYEKSIQQLTLAFDTGVADINTDQEFKALLYLSKSHLGLNHIFKAVKFSDFSIEIAKQNKNKGQLAKAFEHASKISEKRRRYHQAYQQLNRHILFNNEQLAISKAEIISPSDSLDITDYKSIIQNVEIDTLQKNLSNQHTKVVFLKKLLAYLIIFFSIITAIIIYLIFSKRKSKHITKKQNFKLKDADSLNKKLSTETSALRKEVKNLENKVAEKDRLISIVAHDLRSPLNKVKNLSQLINLYGELNKEQQGYIDIIEEVISNGDMLIRDLLFSDYIENHETNLNVKKIEINLFLNNNIRTFISLAAKKNIEIIFTPENQPLEVFTDPMFLNRILDNLISNAIKFSFPDKKIHISAQRTSDEFYTLIIKDQGIGILEEDQKQLFKKFPKINSKPTAGENSTGLGLSITYALIKKLKGDITVSSTPNIGTTFIITLPIHPFRQSDVTEAYTSEAAI
ncbi:ATP-binding protein [Aureibacter tunicatorum]|uniref:histidine kinase n=1 Tax=Aureibacter tunicatorum TaxID=866807 RepID=A0AAE4BSJ1_9BACT|nr:tetratricopeptide repeat-containing sensor histidine kinase [Aureibacter tunicatorum]MDR6239831.1 signal transduction histidine kinase [Aureibacter tunicatorum]BDD04306.1 hypothetical protein AUTU_17890 [Aureibacter tunicatorum]